MDMEKLAMKIYCRKFTQEINTFRGMKCFHRCFATRTLPCFYNPILGIGAFQVMMMGNGLILHGTRCTVKLRRYGQLISSGGDAGDDK